MYFLMASYYILSNAFFKIYEDMVKFLLVLKIFFHDYSDIASLFNGTVTWSEASLFLCNDLFSLRFKFIQDDFSITLPE